MIEGWNERRATAMKEVRSLNPRHHPQGMKILKNISALHRDYLAAMVAHRHTPITWERVKVDFNARYQEMLHELENEVFLTALME